MRFKNIVLEGPDCSGKSTFYKEFHKETNYYYNIKDRYMLSMFVYAKYYNRDNIEYWKEELWNDLKKLNTLYVIFLPSWDIVRKRFLKRGDDIQDEESLKKTYDLYSQTVKEDMGNDLPNILILSPTETHTVYDSIKEVKDYLKVLEEYHGGDLAQDFVKRSGKKEVIDLEFQSEYTLKDIMSDRTLKNLNSRKRKGRINSVREYFYYVMEKEIKLGKELFYNPRDSNRFCFMDKRYINYVHFLYRNKKCLIYVVTSKANATHDIECFYEIVKVMSFDFAKYLKLSEETEIIINMKVRSSVMEWNVVR